VWNPEVLLQDLQVHLESSAFEIICSKVNSNSCRFDILSFGESMQVCFYANMRTLVGKEVFVVADPRGIVTLRDLFLTLVEQYPEIRPQLFGGNNELRQDVPLFVNGRNPRLDGAMDAPLHAEDVISLFSPISSGKMNVEVLRE
jgi:molybdopterin converting factor small subunit